VTFEIQAIARGYLQQTVVFTFTQNRTSYFVSLSPKQFTLGFGLQQLFSDGTTSQFVNGIIESGYQPAAGTTFTPSPADIGGAVRYVGPPAQENQYTIANFRNVTQFVAVFGKILPTTNSPFVIETNNISNLAANYNSSVRGSLLIPVPDFNVTEDRELLILLPYRVNLGFMIVRAEPWNTQNTAPRPFANSFLGCRMYLSGTVQYQYLDGLTSAAAAFEFSVPFGSRLRFFSLNFQGEQFDYDRSNFLDAGGNLLSGNVTTRLFDFDFPTPEFVTSNFEVLANGQWARKKNSNLYVLFNYRLLWVSKKRTTKN